MWELDSTDQDKIVNMVCPPFQRKVNLAERVSMEPLKSGQNIFLNVNRKGKALWMLLVLTRVSSEHISITATGSSTGESQKHSDICPSIRSF